MSVWQAAVPFVAGNSTLIDDLTPGATYQFRVSANNEIGISRPSPISESITLDIESGKSLRVLVDLFTGAQMNTNITMTVFNFPCSG